MGHPLMALPKQGFPSAVSDLELVGVIFYDEQREAAKKVTDTLGHNCTDILEALGFTGHYGWEPTSTGHKRRVRREGTLK